jgi:hypothetical protein
MSTVLTVLSAWGFPSLATMPSFLPFSSFCWWLTSAHARIWRSIDIPVLPSVRTIPLASWKSCAL